MDVNQEDNNQFNGSEGYMVQAGVLGNYLDDQELALPTVAHQRSRILMPSTEVCGRNAEKKMIISHLLNDYHDVENFVVIPIVGPGGMGKTTLAQYVYNDDWVVSHFDLRAWASVSDVVDLKRITTKIIQSANHGTVAFNNPNQSQEIVTQLLRSKKFFIVLDDVWNSIKSHWKQLQFLFSLGACGSRVVITTRFDSVSKILIEDSTISIRLEGLSNESSRLLLQKLVGGDANLLEIQDITTVCSGLPLAIKALAGLLRKEDKSNWPNIIKTLKTQEVGVMSILKLSYHHLQPHLKRILAYCSLFPKDYIIEKNDLIFMWMAEGFIVEEESMEDIGHDYFLELVSRLLFESSPCGEGLFTMHSLIRDLAQWAAGDSCCLMDYGKVSYRTRHVSFTEDARVESFGSLAMTPEVTQKMRTLASLIRDTEWSRFQELHLLDMIPKFSYLRVLSLAHAEIMVLPDSIGQLQHLRYLDLSFTDLIELPRQVGKLFYLQTLFLRRCQVFQKLPESTATLSRLRHLDVYGTSLRQMPLGFGKLLNLRTLNRFVVGAKCGSTIRELKHLRYLRLLSISGLENVVSNDDPSEAKLYEKSDLLELHLEWGSCINDVDYNTRSVRSVMEQLCPSTSLRMCGVKGYMGLTFPEWLGNPTFTNMVDLHLVECENLEFLPPLGHLPSLKGLWVEGMYGIKQVGPEFYGTLRKLKPFQALRTLAFRRMESWKIWSHSSVGNCAFPCLQNLSIMYCPLLVDCLPPHLPSVKVLKIKHCCELRASLPSLPLLEDLEIEQCKALSSNTEAISCLRRMWLGYISEDIRLPEIRPGLEELIIFNCQNLRNVEKIPMMLRRLKISNCQELQFVECGEYHLEQVIIYGCKSMSSLFLKSSRPSLKLVRLTRLAISQCHSFISLPKDIQLPCIEKLEFSNCQRLEALPNLLRLFDSLRSLNVFDCPKLYSISDSGLPKNLTSLRISRVNIQQPIREWGLHLLTSLQILHLDDVGNSSESVDCIPGPNLPLPSSLSSLYIGAFPNLKYISCDPLPNLATVTIHSCPAFEPHNDNCSRLTQLKKFKIQGCWKD